MTISRRGVLRGGVAAPAAMRKNVHGMIAMPDIIPFWNMYKT